MTFQIDSCDFFEKRKFNVKDLIDYQFIKTIQFVYTAKRNLEPRNFNVYRYLTLALNVIKIV